MNKDLLRTKLKKNRAALPDARRQEAALSLIDYLLPLIAKFNTVLSFASFDHEIDTRILNQYLASTGRLLLPRILGNELKVYSVSNPYEQLLLNSFGIYEPSPAHCLEVNIQEIQVVLVPGLGFDSKGGRIGYGKGFYDRFLKDILGVPTIGIGFKEQLIKKIPIETTDVPLKKVSLF